MAPADGATDAELRETVAMAAIARHCSAVPSGMLVDRSTLHDRDRPRIAPV
jgi:alkylhydroperoxidase/carboxymuconolactone decarboxylase family protein YurZ